MGLKSVEQRRSFTLMRRIARPLGLRVEPDEMKWGCIQGELGSVEYFCSGNSDDCDSDCPIPGQPALAVHAIRRNWLWPKLLREIPGAQLWYHTIDGAASEFRVLAPATAILEVASLIRAQPAAPDPSPKSILRAGKAPRRHSDRQTGQLPVRPKYRMRRAPRPAWV